jgi:hypothetical protein
LSSACKIVSFSGKSVNFIIEKIVFLFILAKRTRIMFF